MKRNAKLVACIALLLASTFFISVTILQQNQRNEGIRKLSNDTWSRQMIAEAFPDYPVITRLDEVTNTSEQLKVEIKPNIAEIIVGTLGWQPEYYRVFMVYQREPDPVQWDPTNHYHFGFIASDLRVYDLGLDVMFE